MKKIITVFAAMLLLSSCVSTQMRTMRADGSVEMEYSHQSAFVGILCNVPWGYFFPIVWDYPQWYWAQPPKR